MKSKIIITTTIIAALLLIFGCSTTQKTIDDTKETTQKKPYSDYLEKRISQEETGQEQISKRPDYLPPAMFQKLPLFPEDFYKIRTLIKTGRITDLGELDEKYWMQPEFFPQFEEIGVPLLQNPPENRWGAYGIAVYPADTVATIAAGDSIELHFFIKSNYLVETYQGINLFSVFPAKSKIESGGELPDGTTTVTQDPKIAKEYIKINVEPNPFILEPNFPTYKINGTRKIKATITISKNIPSGNYVVGLDTGDVPEEYEKEWIKKYLNLYTEGGMTKIDRPYYRVFINVP